MREKWQHFPASLSLSLSRAPPKRRDRFLKLVEFTAVTFSSQSFQVNYWLRVYGTFFETDRKDFLESGHFLRNRSKINSKNLKWPESPLDEQFWQKAKNTVRPASCFLSCRLGVVRLAAHAPIILENGKLTCAYENYQPRFVVKRITTDSYPFVILATHSRQNSTYSSSEQLFSSIKKFLWLLSHATRYSLIRLRWRACVLTLSRLRWIILLCTQSVREKKKISEMIFVQSRNPSRFLWLFPLFVL